MKHPLRHLLCGMLLTCLVISLPASAQPNPEATKPTATQVPPGVKPIADIRYVPDGDPSQSLDLFLPEAASAKPLPLIVWIHGGGWHGGTKLNPPGLEFTKDGYAVASVEYRFSQKAIFPAQIQ